MAKGAGSRKNGGGSNGKMNVSNIDSEGRWHVGGKGGYSVSLLGLQMPIPEDARLDKTDEEVLFIAKAIDFLEYCPMCEMAIYEDTVVIGMENARLVPFYCCNLMAWFMESDPEEE
jgi:hypothetical protein